MNNNWFKAIIDKVFRSGDPAALYIGINVLVFLVITVAAQVYSGSFITEYLALPASINFLPLRIYTLFTYQFLNYGLLNVLSSMIILYWTGIIFMDFLKARQFHLVYLLGGVIGGLIFVAASSIFPTFQSYPGGKMLLGSSAAIMSIAVAAATLVPDYSIKLLLFGFVKLKYIVLILLVLDVVFIGTTNPGGALAHLGGALTGFVYIKLLQSGFDMSSFLKRKPKLKVVKNNNYTGKRADIVNQQEIDAILDKISSSGYENLTTEEKSKLFSASQK